MGCLKPSAPLRALCGEYVFGTYEHYPIEGGTTMIDETTTANRAIVIGALGALRRRGREATLVSGRTATRGAVGRFALELASPLGDPFALELEVGAGVSGRELLDATAEGGQLAVEGEVLLRASLDPRYARGPDDPRREVRVLALRVHALRTPRDDEPTASSAVWLEGSVAEPPRCIRHAENRALCGAAGAGRRRGRAHGGGAGGAARAQTAAQCPAADRADRLRRGPGTRRRNDPGRGGRGPPRLRAPAA